MWSFAGFVFSFFAFINNYATWVAYHDGPDYYYNRQKNGFWAIFYFIALWIFAYRLDYG